MDPPENEVDKDVITLLFTSEYARDYVSNNEELDTSTQQHLWVIHPDAMPPTASNVYNIYPRDTNDYAKERVD